MGLGKRALTWTASHGQYTDYNLSSFNHPSIHLPCCAEKHSYYEAETKKCSLEELMAHLYLQFKCCKGYQDRTEKTPVCRSNDRFHRVGEVSGFDQDLIRNTEAHAIAWAPEGDRCIKHVSISVYTHLPGKFQSLCLQCCFSCLKMRLNNMEPVSNRTSCP